MPSRENAVWEERGGFKHDDRIENLFLAHKACNRDQGSRSFDDYIAMKLELRSGA
jgi:5-methylcytosine-specific restriction endonuclease McrA